MDEDKKIFIQLSQGLLDLEIELSEIQQKKLIQFLKLLSKWNQHYNLTGIQELNKMVSYHLLDSLSIAPYIIGNQIADIGAGAGFPSIPLAIHYPNKKFALIEPTGKKVNFLIQACIQCEISNIITIQKRSEELSKQDTPFDCIVSRALCSLSHLIKITHHLAHIKTRWIAMKGALEEKELQELNNMHSNYQVIPLKIPGVATERNAVIIEPPFELS